MVSIERPRKLLIDSLKVILVASLFFLLQAEILGVRYDLYGHQSGVAIAESKRNTERDELERHAANLLRDCAFEVGTVRNEVQDALMRLDDRREEIYDLVDTRARELEGALLSRWEAQRDTLTSAQAALEAGVYRLEKIGTRDSSTMKRKMVHPTVLLKGNGTVGSGVIVYSEPMPGAAEGAVRPYATFVITAYHVVMEVLGGQTDVGRVEEIQVSQGEDPTFVEVFSGLLVLCDRARDVALLKLNTSRKFEDVADLTPRDELNRVDIFARAYAVGCPLGNRPLPTIGEVSSKSKIVADQVFWMLSAPTFFGNSGGGIYLAETSKLIGISSMIYTYGKSNPTVVPHMGLFVPLDTIYAWLDGEGYSFVHERQPVPREVLPKLDRPMDPVGGSTVPAASSDPSH